VKDPQLSEAIKGYEMSLMSLALRLAGRDGAEVDDLLQEGRISIWQAIKNGAEPSLAIAFKRMLAWVRTLRPQNPAPYEEIEHGGE
jgi:DNA-directed RNA polymerase specialized sigma24 family protein